jgi:hypothetical protein
MEILLKELKFVVLTVSKLSFPIIAASSINQFLAAMVQMGFNRLQIYNKDKK